MSEHVDLKTTPDADFLIISTKKPSVEHLFWELKVAFDNTPRTDQACFFIYQEVAEDHVEKWLLGIHQDSHSSLVRVETQSINTQRLLPIPLQTALSSLFPGMRFTAQTRLNTSSAIFYHQESNLEMSPKMRALLDMLHAQDRPDSEPPRP